MTGNATKIVELDRQRMEAMGSRDIPALNRLLSDDLFYVHSSARVDTKATLIGAVESGATVYRSVVPSEVTARDLGCGGVDRGGGDRGDIGRQRDVVPAQVCRCVCQSRRKLANDDLAKHQTGIT
jgi:hypothetical protein